MEEDKENATKLMQSYLIEWRNKFVKNWKELLRMCQKEKIYKLCKETGDVNILWELRMKGADAKSLEKRGFSCIPQVFWNEAMIGFFLRQGCDINARDKADGNTGLNLAVHFLWEKNDGVIQFLFENGADPNIPDYKDRIPIFHLTTTVTTYFNERQHIKIFGMLLNHGTNLRAKDPTNGDIVLHKAVELFLINIKSLGKCLDKFDGNVDDVRSDSGKTPLMVAVEKRNTLTCQLLIDKGADVNAKDANGYTALHHCCIVYISVASYRILCYNPCLDLLMKNNADPNIRSNSGRDVYELACLLEVEFTKGAKPSKLIQIHEMNGALAIIRDRNYKEGLHQWKEALDICAKDNVKPSTELVLNYELAPEDEEGEKSDKIKLDLFRAALRTMDRISTGSSKFWNVLFAAIPVFKETSNKSDELIQILKSEVELFVSDKMMSFQECEDFASPEYINIGDLVILLDRLYYNKNYITSNISFILNAAKFATSYLSKWKTKAGRINLALYSYQTCVILTRIGQTNHHALSKKWIAEEIKNLIKTIVELDPIDDDHNQCNVIANYAAWDWNQSKGYSLLHHACQKWENRELVQTIIDFGANFRSVNRDNKLPIQLISSHTFKDPQNLIVIKKMIDKDNIPNLTTVDGKQIKDLLI